jgi:hypothetical protein
VLKCQEVGTDKEVAIKLLRNNEHMKRTGKKEVRILRQLRDSDPEGKSNNIRLLNDFEVPEACEIFNNSVRTGIIYVWCLNLWIVTFANC